MNQEGKMEWLTLHELVVCNTYGCLVLFDWQVVWRLGCYLFTLVLLHWAPTWLGIKWEMPSYGSICLWHGHRASCNFTIFLYNSTVLISWNIDLIWIFFWLRVYWENRNGKTFSCSKTVTCTIKTHLFWLNLVKLASSESDALESFAELKVYSGCFRNNMLIAFSFLLCFGNIVSLNMHILCMLQWIKFCYIFR